MKRYLLDLSELFTDHRRKAYIGYRPTWTTVASVIGSIRCTFNIQPDLYICSEDGIFYPEGESVELIEDEQVIKVLPKEHVAKEKTRSDDEPRKRRVSNLLQESSTYEDIEATLLSLPKPKRRRVRKRKTKQDSREEPAPSQTLPRTEEAKVQQPVSDTEHNNGHIRFSHQESQSSEGSKSSEEVELPYRNLNRTMKARVVRAVSSQALIDRSSRNGSDPSAATTASSNGKPANSEQTQPIITKPNIKARVVRATNGGSTVEVKQEQLEASAPEQSYQPQTTVADDTDVIEIDAPTHVNGEEATCGGTPATPAV
uniref:Coilin_N domain-containing protein n=1 Tax=Anopheles stephensi TaxID=30069 RepID=A0A182Y5M4_ANOST